MPGVAEGDLILWPVRQAVNEPAAAPVAEHVPGEPGPEMRAARAQPYRSTGTRRIFAGKRPQPEPVHRLDPERKAEARALRASGESTDAGGRPYSVLKTLYRCKKSLKPSLKRPVAPTCSVGST